MVLSHSLNSHYIAMEYVPGFTLQTMIANAGVFTCANALPVLQQLAEAVDYAHSQGIIHRDIKPANILVDDSGAGIRVVLTDFGLAKAMEGSSALTSGGTLLGSLEYMAPEQADPNRAGAIGPATDLYALGIVAYQMFTGRVPFPGNGMATLNGHLTMEVPNPQRFAPKLPDAAVKALHKMLMKNPTARFATARSFVDALRTEASPEISPKSTVNVRPLENPGPPISLESELSIHQDDGITDNNRDVISAKNCERLELAQTLDGGPVIFSDEGRVLAFYGAPHVLNVWDIAQGTLRYTLPASNAVFSPAGDVLATDLDKTRVWRVDDGEPVYSVNGHNPKFSSKGLWLATEEKNNTSLWWASGGRFLQTLEGSSLGFSPDETLAATRLPGPQVKLWDLQTRQLIQTLEVESEWEDLEFRNVVGGAFSPTGLFFVVVAVYGNVQSHYIGDGATEEIIRCKAVVNVWDLQNHQRHCARSSPLAYNEPERGSSHRYPWEVPAYPVFFPDIQRMVIGKSLWDSSQWEFIARLHHSSVSKQRGIAALARQDAVGLIELVHGQPVGAINVPKLRADTLAFSLDGRVLVTVNEKEHRQGILGWGKKTYSYLVKIWNTQTVTLLRTLFDSPDPVKQIVFSPCGRTLVLGTAASRSSKWESQIWRLSR